MNALALTGNSSNIYFYRETGRAADEPYTWAEVLVSAIEKRDGRWRAKRVPDYTVTIYRRGVGEVAKIRHTPKTRPRSNGAPSPRTVTRIVREALT